ncbi:MAG: HypC/HybG/HupF family hydrogenase formation chaperone [Candidatus Buchananbacteria bacterium]
MCLTIPVQIKEIKDQKAKLANGKMVKLDLIKNPKPGDWLLVNADLALKKITAVEAKEIKNLFK